MSGTDIFLSYARHDRERARMFAECLAEEGFSVWWDASLRSGETFDEVIERKLRDAKAVVVLWSPASVASRWVRAEATLADRRNKLAPAIIEQCDRPIIFELTHAAELSDWRGDKSDIRWRTFVSDLHGLVDAGSPAEDLVAAPARARPAPPAARHDDGIAGPDAPPGHRMLRPGNDDVIYAERTRHRPQVPRDALEAATAGDQPAEAEVHCLEIEEGNLAQQRIVVNMSGMKIGRTPPADAVLSDASISREHCIIGLANDELLVTDLNSTNGTYIDGVRISRAAILPVGSILRVGQVSLRHAVRLRGEAEQRSRPGSTTRERFTSGQIAATS